MRTTHPGGGENFDEDFVELYRPFLTPERTHNETEAIGELLDLTPGKRVLDLACGWARHSIELARHGIVVTGVDLSETLLERAHRRAGAAGVQVEWVQRDMRDLQWRSEFDAALSLVSSLGYFLDDPQDLQVLRGVARVLRPEGLLLLETMHRDQVVRSFAERDWWPGEYGPPV